MSTGPIEIRLADVRRLVVAPGETLLVTLPIGTRLDDAGTVAERLRSELPTGVHVLVVTEDVRIEVVARGDEPQP